jgi:hypothetical protein
MGRYQTGVDPYVDVDYGPDHAVICVGIRNTIQWLSGEIATSEERYTSKVNRGWPQRPEPGPRAPHPLGVRERAGASESQ